MEEPVDAGAPKREISGSDAMLGRVAAPGEVSPETRAAIERVLKGYGQALTLGDMAEALRRYPGHAGRAAGTARRILRDRRTLQRPLEGHRPSGQRKSRAWRS